MKAAGGLGLKDLNVQNVCLLLKLIHSLHLQQESSWARWVQTNANVASLTGDLHGHHWDMLRSLLPIYRAITTVLLGNGRSTSFWHDVWHGEDSMAERFPQLFTHCTNPELTVQQAVEGGLQSIFVARWTAEARQQLVQIMDILDQTTLQQVKDRRLSPMTKKNGHLDTAMLYKALKMDGSSTDTWTKFIWNSKAPPRVQFFAWLLSQGRIQCRTNLMKKKIVDSAECEICHSVDETTNHVFFGCAAAKEFWDAVGIQTDQAWSVSKLLEIDAPAHIPRAHFTTFITLCCWNIWKRRNDTVFRDDRTTLRGALMACKTEARLWKARLPRKDAAVGDSWCTALSNSM